jgi:hypothetical protein
LWGRNNDWFLYSTAPKPADFAFDLFAPRKQTKPSRVPEATGVANGENVNLR